MRSRARCQPADHLAAAGAERAEFEAMTLGQGEGYAEGIMVARQLLHMRVCWCCKTSVSRIVSADEAKEIHAQLLRNRKKRRR